VLRRLGVGWTRARRAEAGQGTLEYVGILAAAAVLIALVIATVASPQVRTEVVDGVRSAACQITGQSGCEQGSGGGAGSSTTDGSSTRGGTDEGSTDEGSGCEGLLGCAWGGVKQVGSGAFNIGKGAVDDVVGVVDLIKDPGSIVDAGKYIWQNPGDAAKQMVWDDESDGMWGRGDHGGAVGRTIWNVGSWFIPGVNIARAGSKVGKLGQLADVAKLTKLSDEAAAAARKADDALARGDLDGAQKADDEARQKAADEARQKADEAAEQARKQGCPIAARLPGAVDDATVLSLPAGDAGGDRLLSTAPLHLAAHLIHAGGNGECGDAQDAARRADEDADAAQDAVDDATTVATGGGIGLTDDAVSSAYQGMRSGGGHAIRHLREEGLIPDSGSLASQVRQFEELTTPILQSPSSSFDWRLGGTASRAFAGTVNGKNVVVFVATEGPFKGRVLSAVVPDANQAAQWGCHDPIARGALVERQ